MSPQRFKVTWQSGQGGYEQDAGHWTYGRRRRALECRTRVEIQASGTYHDQPLPRQGQPGGRPHRHVEPAVILVVGPRYSADGSVECMARELLTQSVPQRIITSFEQACMGLIRTGEGIGVLGIDGLAASGKTTISCKIHELRPSWQLLHLDSLQRPHAERSWLGWSAAESARKFVDTAPLAAILTELRAGRLAQYRPYNWVTRSLGATRCLRPYGALVVEGTYSTRVEVQHLIDFVVWVEASRGVRRARMAGRPAASQGWLRAWIEGEDHYASTRLLRATPDLRISESERTDG